MADAYEVMVDQDEAMLVENPPLYTDPMFVSEATRLCLVMDPAVWPCLDDRLNHLHPS